MTIPFEIKRLALIGAVAIPTTLGLSFWHPFTPLMGFLLKLGLGGLGYLGLLFGLGFLLPEEKRRLRSLFQRPAK